MTTDSSRSRYYNPFVDTRTTVPLKESWPQNVLDVRAVWVRSMEPRVAVWFEEPPIKIDDQRWVLDGQGPGKTYAFFNVSAEWLA